MLSSFYIELKSIRRHFPRFKSLSLQGQRQACHDSHHHAFLHSPKEDSGISKKKLSSPMGVFGHFLVLRTKISKRTTHGNHR